MDTGSGSKKPKRGRKAVLLRTNLALLSFVLAWLPGPSPSQHTGFIDNYKRVCAIHIQRPQHGSHATYTCAYNTPAYITYLHTIARSTHSWIHTHWTCIDIGTHTQYQTHAHAYSTLTHVRTPHTRLS